MSVKISINFIFLALTILAVTLNMAEAQILGGEKDALFIELRQLFEGPDKTLPGPNEPYEARLLSAVIDTRSADIVWYLDGKIVNRGLGRNTYVFTTGRVGSRMSLRATARAADGSFFEASKSLTINDVDILWSSETTIPAWYKGKALASAGSAITLSAFPEIRRGGVRISADRLVYRWSIDGRALTDVSGAGRNVIAFRTANAPAEFEHEITLEVADLTGTSAAQKTIRIALVDPEIGFYEEHPLEGPLNHLAIARISMPPGEEKEFRASPYFFSRGERITYEWLIDRKRVENEGGAGILRIRVVPEAAGLISVETLIKNTISVLQQTAAQFIINVR